MTIQDQVMAAQGSSQCRGLLRVGISELGYGEASGVDFGQNNVQRDIARELGKVIVAPDDRVCPD